MVFAAMAVAIAGAVVLTRSFRTSRDGGCTWEEPPGKKGKPLVGSKPKTRSKKS